jgi:chromosome segregation ATPase
MSQSNSGATDASTDSNNDSSPDLKEQLASVREQLDDLEDVADMDDLELVELRTEVKELEDSVEDARKDVVESELETRVEPGEKLFGLHRIESHNKFVAEDAGAVIARAALQGINWTEFVELKASKLASEHPGLAEIGQYDYTYFR